MKSIGHIYMANIIRDEIINNNGKVTLIYDKNKKSYQVPDDILDALTLYPEEFRAGAIGPDLFPDLITGQMIIHPTHSGKWLEFMMEELQGIPRDDKNKNQCPYRRALAFYLGYMMHYAGDMFTHRYVNTYAKGWFPSWGGIIDNISSMDLAKEVKAFKDLMIIVRHMCLESYLDDYIREQYISTFENKDDGAEVFRRELIGRIPLEYVRSCFGTAKAVNREHELKKTIAKESGQSYEECYKFDVLETFVKKMEKLKEQIGKSGATNYRVGNLQDREQDIDRWIMLWQHFGNEMNTVGFGAALSDYKEEALKLFTDFKVDSEGLRNFIQGIFTTVDVLDSIDIYIPIFALIKYMIKASAKSAFYSAVKDEYSAIYLAIMQKPSKAKNFDQMIDEMKEIVKNPEIVLASELVMGEKNLPQKLKKEWGTIGKNRNALKQDFEELQRAINYGKLCFMGVDNLNSFFGKKLFKSQEQHYGVSQLRVYISTSNKTYSGTNADVIFCVKKVQQSIPSNIQILDKPYEDDFEAGSKQEFIVTLTETLDITEIERFEIHLKGKKDLWRTNCIRISDDATGIILSERYKETTLRKGEHVELPMQVEIDKETGELVRTNSIDKLNIEIQTSNDTWSGTDGDVHFTLVRKDEAEERHLLDKSGYNDFEKGDLDTYSITLRTALKSLDEISHFRIHSSATALGGWKINYAKVYEAQSGMCIAAKTFNKVLKNSSVDLPLLKEMNKEERNTWKIQNLLVTVHTADEFLAGTDGDIYFKVNYIDDNGKPLSESFLLDISGHNDFERDTLDTYTIKLSKKIVATKISGFEVYKKNGNDWKCHFIQVYERDTNTMLGYEACNRWLGSSSDSICVPIMETWYN